MTSVTVGGLPNNPHRSRPRLFVRAVGGHRPEPLTTQGFLGFPHRRHPANRPGRAATVHAQLEAIADAVRQLPTADVDPDYLMTVGQVAETVKVMPCASCRPPT